MDYDQKYDMAESVLPNAGAAQSANSADDNGMRAPRLELGSLAAPDPKAHAVSELSPNPGGSPPFAPSVADSAMRKASSINDLESTTKSTTRLAIVGSVSLAGNGEAREAIEQVLDRYRPALVVSGGAKGIDSMAAAAAKRRGIPVKEYLPAVPSWEGGYKPRNLLIAQNCDALVRIVAVGSTTYGSGWTRDRARELGKPTEEIVIHAGKGRR